jgi:hypothetical protein
MFTKKQFLARWRSEIGGDAPPLELVRFGYKAFVARNSEQALYAIRGQRADCPDPLRFWIKAQEALDWQQPEPYFTRIAESVHCEPITQAEFAETVQRYSSGMVLPLPAFIQQLDGYEAGLRMHDAWNRQAVLAQLPTSYLLFEWGTSA